MHLSCDSELYYLSAAADRIVEAVSFTWCIVCELKTSSSNFLQIWLWTLLEFSPKIWPGQAVARFQIVESDTTGIKCGKGLRNA